MNPDVAEAVPRLVEAGVLPPVFGLRRYLDSGAGKERHGYTGNEKPAEA